MYNLTLSLVLHAVVYWELLLHRRGMKDKGVCATPDSIGYLGKWDLVGIRGNWWDW